MTTRTRSGTLPAVRFDVRVIPRARAAGVGGSRDGALLVRVAAAPADGAANRAVILALAEALDVPKRAVTIATGHASPRKIVDVSAADPERVRTRLAELRNG
jgi:uncharacterized protein YggU (UPF0235/DUF167 family)